MNWKKVDKLAGENACWLWRGTLSGGYPQGCELGKRYQPVRQVYEDFVGMLIPGLPIRQRCGNKACVRPEHLTAGIDNKMSATRTEERFNKYVARKEDDECWPWTGCKSHNGYGRLWNGSRFVPATHYAWEKVHGRRVPPGLVIMHTCDEPACCNPAHLKVGTQTENVADRDAKGRTCKGDRQWQRMFPERRLTGDRHYYKRRPELILRGARNGRASLTEDKILAIRSMRSDGMSQQAIADRLGVGQTTISSILLGQTWRHVR